MRVRKSKTEWGGKIFWIWPHACRWDGCIFAYSWLGFLWYPANSELDKWMEQLNREEDEKES